MPSGTNPDSSDLEGVGTVLALAYAPALTSTNVDNILYDSIGESDFDPADTVGTGNSNLNEICLSNNGSATFVIC